MTKASLVALAVVLSLPAPASAADPLWQVFQPAERMVVDTVATPGGNAVFVQRSGSRGTIVAAGRNGVVNARRSLGFRPLQSIGFGTDGLAIAGTDSAGRTVVATGSAAGGALSVRRLPKSSGRPIDLAANARGDVALVTGRRISRRSRDQLTRGVWVLRRGDRRVSRVLTFPDEPIVRTSVRNARVAVGAGGELLVAWWQRDMTLETGLVTQTRSAAGQWSPPQVVVDEIGESLRVAVDDAGRRTIAWRGDAAQEAAGNMNEWLKLSSAAAGELFPAPQTVAVAFRTSGAVVVLAGGGRMLAWTGFDYSPERQMAVRVSAVTGGIAGPPQSISAPGKYPELVAATMAPSGAAVVALASVDPSRRASRCLHVATRSAADTAFGAAEQADPDCSEWTLTARPFSTALDPNGGSPLIAYAGKRGAAKVAVR